MKSFEVIVIGGGHAGVEAAWAAANLLPGRATVALVTLDPGKIGVMSCNPAIGGLAKGQLVREIDSLGGVMGLATDATGIQFKVLNTSKGPAVHGPRAQCDKHAYAECVQALIASRPEIQVIAGSVDRLLVEGGRVRGVRVAHAERPDAKLPNGQIGATDSCASRLAILPLGTFDISAPAVVLTTGTFMRGLMHTGETKTEGGRFGEAAAIGISGALRELGFELGRLKTGTPPRLKRSTIRWNELQPQQGDDPPTPFSELSGRAPGSGSWDAEIARHSPSIDRFPILEQVECRQTHTTLACHELIRSNLHRAPMYSGQIESVGPRYCPSIEDKVVRFAERETHGVFLEPESLRDDWIYCNGISTSLPADVQDAIVRSMPGCERAHIYRYGYAVEYDMVRPHQIHATGMTKLVEGLFLAGQINGTSGYEEAGAQGLVAGVNAARWARGQGEWVLGRDQAYIGVLMDDLVTKTPVEPYRMFTSRAEHRLLLRADNAPDRLTPIAMELGLLESTALGRARRAAFEWRTRSLAALSRFIARAPDPAGGTIARAMLTPDYTFERFAEALRTSDDAELGACGLTDRSAGDGDARRGGDAHGSVMRQPAIRGVEMTAYADHCYRPYLVRQQAEIKRHAELEHRRLPDDADYASWTHLRTEARAALAKFKPRTFGQAGRLEGVTPADVTLLAVLVKKHHDERGGRPNRRSEPGANE
ncbi:MAG: FAD-dependent oxidoreductase [Planctomycetota bacterium]|nr:FAD-dependent oxidoreductase [Planctomycetota bacterium]